MKGTGIVRNLDDLGRITLPIELRRTLGIGERDPIEIYIEDDRIILKKFETRDVFGSIDSDLLDYKGKKVSKASVSELAKLVGLI